MAFGAACLSFTGNVYTTTGPRIPRANARNYRQLFHHGPPLHQHFFCLQHCLPHMPPGDAVASCRHITNACSATGIASPAGVQTPRSTVITSTTSTAWLRGRMTLL